jgi:hypothetical protein
MLPNSPIPKMMVISDETEKMRFLKRQGGYAVFNALVVDTSNGYSISGGCYSATHMSASFPTASSVSSNRERVASHKTTSADSSRAKPGNSSAR